MSEPGAGTATPVRVVGNPLPVRVTGSAVPVVVQNAAPIRVVNSGPPDTIAVWTLAAALGALAFAILTFAWTLRSIHLAKLDLETTLRQAGLADEERARRPSFEAALSINGTKYSDSLSLPGPVIASPLALLLHNRGPQRATDLTVNIKTSAGLMLYTTRIPTNAEILSKSEHKSFLDMRAASVASTELLNCDYWNVTAEHGEHTLYWQVSGAEGSWPCPSSAPDEQWGRIHVNITGEATPS